MTSFDSPLGKKNFSSTQMKELDIPDENENSFKGTTRVDINQIREFQSKLQRDNMPIYEQDTAELEKQIRQAREDKKHGRERLSEGAKKRIEMLVGMTRGSRQVEIEGNNFVLRTLKSKEMREALTEAAQFDGTIQSPFEIRRQFLARSIVEIAGVSIEQFIGSNSAEDKCLFIDELDESVLNRLYDEYLILVKEFKDKYAIKTEEEIKEFIGDIKK